MRRLVFPVAVLALVPLLVACTGGTSPTETDPVDDPTMHVKIVTEDFDVPAGDVFECLYTDTISDREMTVVSADGVQQAGGHHILVYYVDEQRAPEHHPCTDEEMTGWHQVVGAGGENTGEPVITLPDGLGFLVPEGKQMVIQAHYINTTGETQRYHDEVTLNLVEPDSIKAYANLLSVTDLQFKVQASGSTTHTSVATLKKDVQLVILGGHMHEVGQHFKLETLDAQGNVATSLIDEKWAPAYVSHPPLVTRTMDDPLILKSGTTLRQTCTWDNSTQEELVFPREMCVTFGYFFPDKGTGQQDYLTHPEKP